MVTRRRLIQSVGYAGLGLGFTGFTNRAIAQNVKKISIKVGILHSLSGTMAISEKSTVDATLLAIDEIDQAGGVLGRSIEAILEDGPSDWPTFSEKAKKLIRQDQVATVFGCWTSASRKSVLPILSGAGNS